MKKLLVCALSALAVLSLSASAARADQFDQLANSPATYWVPAPTPPPPGYVDAPPPSYYYGPPPPYYYYGPPRPRVVVVPHFFIGFHFH